MRFLSKLRELGYRFRSQNLNERRDGSDGPKFAHGRASFVTYERNDLPGLEVEWVHGDLALDLQLELDRDDREITLKLGVPGGKYYVSLKNVPRALLELLPFDFGGHGCYGSPRAIGVRTFGGAVWFSVWETVHMSSHRDPWWMRGRIGLDDVADFLFGKTKYSKQVLEERTVKIPMPEGTYDATVTIELARWTRARFPWRPLSKQRVGSDVKIPQGIGFPGKGENSWDCGDDALFGISCRATTVEAAIGETVASALRNRQRYGGTHAFTPTSAS